MYIYTILLYSNILCLMICWNIKSIKPLVQILISKVDTNAYVNNYYLKCLTNLMYIFQENKNVNVYTLTLKGQYGRRD